MKGGVGKTTTAVHLAAFLSNHGPTLLVDADPAGGALTWQAQGSRSTAQVLTRAQGLPFAVHALADAHPKRFEHVVYDTRSQPRSKHLETFADKADLVIVPTTPNTLSVATLQRLLRELDGWPVRGLVTLAPPPPSKDVVRTLAQLAILRLPHFETPIRRYAVFEKAVLAGVTARDVVDQKAPPAWADYEAVGRELLRLARA